MTWSNTTRSGIRRRWHPHGWVGSNSGRSDSIRAANSTHRGSIRDAGSRGTDSPGDHQDFSNPMITCGSVPLPVTTRRVSHVPGALRRLADGLTGAPPMAGVVLLRHGRRSVIPDL